MTEPPAAAFEGALTLVNRENPWPGLAAFREDHAEFFHGRGREVEDLFTRVRLNPLTVLYGQSGLGKTSLVQAALFPRLRSTGYVPVSIRIDYSAKAEAARLQICRAIAAAVQAAGGRARALGEYESLWEYFHRLEPAATDAAGRPLTIALAFDQFEELFTLGVDRADSGVLARDFIEELGSLSEHRPPSSVESEFDRDPQVVEQFDFDRRDYRLLVSLREDFLAHLHDLSGRIPAIKVNNMRLAPLDGDRALEVVERPGAGIVAAGAAKAIVRFVADAGDERREGGARKEGDTGSRQPDRPIGSLEVDPSLLSLFCRELNEKRGTGMITPALVAASRERILSEFYERALADLHPGVRLFVEEDLLTAKGFRQTLSLDSADERLKEYGASLDAVRTLVDRRLLHYEQRGRLTRVELTHDVLTRVVRESRSERQAKEAEESKRREAEEAERRAEAARGKAEQEKATAQAQLAQIRRRQRVTRALLGVVAVLAGAAIFGLARATAERTKSTAMLEDFCSYGLDVINRFGDSTAGNPELTNAYNLLIEISDRSVENMLKANPERACPHQLEVRTEVAASGIQDQLKHFDAAIRHGYIALNASRNLAQFQDRLSRQVLAQTYADLTYRLWHLDANDSAAVAAREGLPAAAAIDPAEDPIALDRRARIYHYGVLALLDIAKRDTVPEQRTAHVAEAGGMADSGLAIVERGLGRRDQLGGRLVVSKAQLLFRRGEVDSTLGDTAQAIESFHQALDVLYRMDLELKTLYSLWWRAVGHSAMGGLTLQLRRFDEANAAYDSALAAWHGYIVEYRAIDMPSEVEDGYQNVVTGLLGKARAAGRSGAPDLAIGLVGDAIDSARAGFAVRSSPRAHANLSAAYNSAADFLESLDRRDLADPYYLARVRADSLILAQQRRATVGSVEDVDRGILKMVAVFRQRSVADTAGKAAPGQVRILRDYEERIRGWRERDVAVREQLLRIAMRSAVTGSEDRQTRLRDSVAESRGNLSWSDLLTGRPEHALEILEDTMAVSERHSFILPNQFNAQVMAGRRSEAAEFFQVHGGQSVEQPPVLFACAVVRDIRELLWRGTATEDDVQFVERLAAPHIAQCRLPKTPGTS